jgi:ER membrane protein complex subunit 3
MAIRGLLEVDKWVNLLSTSRACVDRAIHRYEAFAIHGDVHMQETGVLMQEMPSVNMQEKIMSDPSMMTNMMKKQLTGTAPHLLMGFIVNQFFVGFIMGKIPFTLSPKFKSMLQRGIDMSSLNVSYFTSLSFYILLLFGLRGILSLIFSGDIIDEAAVMQQSMGGSNPTFDPKSEFNGEKQRFDLVCFAATRAAADKIVQS